MRHITGVGKYIFTNMMQKKLFNTNAGVLSSYNLSEDRDLFI